MTPLKHVRQISFHLSEEAIKFRYAGKYLQKKKDNSYRDFILSRNATQSRLIPSVVSTEYLSL